MNTVVGIVARRHFEVKDNTDENTDICKLKVELEETRTHRGKLRLLLDHSLIASLTEAAFWHK